MNAYHFSVASGDYDLHLIVVEADEAAAKARLERDDSIWRNGKAKFHERLPVRLKRWRRNCDSEFHERPCMLAGWMVKL
jgi:hypothetical protein